MNDTCFTIYLAGYSMEYGREATDVCSWRLTRDLYIKNCDMRTAGNFSSIYQTLIAVTNLANQRFYHEDDIVNDFLERMSGLLPDKVDQLARKFAHEIFRTESRGHRLQHPAVEIRRLDVRICAERGAVRRRRQKVISGVEEVRSRIPRMTFMIS